VRRGLRAAAVAVALAACGLKNNPVAPELVRPLAPAKVTAASTRDGVELRWRRPTAYTGGGRMRDLAGFDVERAAVTAGPFAKVGTLALTDQQRFRQQRDITWTDREVEPGTEYVYRVIAFTTDGSRSAPSSPVQIRYAHPSPAASPGD
jgi:fibronectin type III domain protein